jgi:hypothetical protein
MAIFTSALTAGGFYTATHNFRYKKTQILSSFLSLLLLHDALNSERNYLPVLQLVLIFSEVTVLMLHTYSTVRRNMVRGPWTGVGETQWQIVGPQVLCVVRCC